MNPKVKNFLIYLVGIIAVGLLVYFGGDLVKTLVSIKSKAAISVDSSNKKAEVYINGAYVGATPFESTDIKPGENKITLKTDTRQYETAINFLANNKRYIHNVGIFRDLGVSDTFSSGQEFWFEPSESGDILRIVTSPSNASVFIDNTDVGKTPYTSNKLTDGSYNIRVELAGYEAQTARLNIKKDYTLNVSMKLFPTPTQARIETFKDAQGLYNVYTLDSNAANDTDNWIKAILYWNDTRGLSIAEQGIKKDRFFDYFVDYKGNIYDNTGARITSEQIKEKITKTDNGAYLNKSKDDTALTTEAVKSLELVKSGITASKYATILETGLGWLRVRDLPNTNGKELAKVNTGEKYPVLEEQTEWIKIKVSDTIQGWVSATYAEVK